MEVVIALICRQERSPYRVVGQIDQFAACSGAWVFCCGIALLGGLHPAATGKRAAATQPLVCVFSRVNEVPQKWRLVAHESSVSVGRSIAVDQGDVAGSARVLGSRKEGVHRSALDGRPRHRLGHQKARSAHGQFFFLAPGVKRDVVLLGAFR